MFVLPTAVLVLCLYVDSISGHGRLLTPPSRSSIWRTVDAAPKNYVDDQLNCGGKPTQYKTYGGKCGVCGDAYGDPHPQDNENTGKYGKGIIAATYSAGATVATFVELTTNHMGSFQFHLCQLGNANGPESGEGCFQLLQLGDGTTKYQLPNKSEQGPTKVNVNVKLPGGLKCSRCVFRWTYTAGNNWGVCADGSQAMGCGEQETFRGCSDITIT